jgi:hypothetical protein
MSLNAPRVVANEDKVQQINQEMFARRAKGAEQKR